MVETTARVGCRWTIHDAFEDDFWETECGNAFILMDGTPTENKMKYCPYCGFPLEEQEKVVDSSDEL